MNPFVHQRNRKEGLMPLYPGLWVKKDTARTDETPDERLDRRLDMIHEVEEWWKSTKYEDYYRCEEKEKTEVFNRWEENFIEVKTMLKARTIRDKENERLMDLIGIYNRNMLRLEEEHGHPNYPWRIVLLQDPNIFDKVWDIRS